MEIPHPVDRLVGQRLRQRRKQLDLSQQELASRLGVTFQQVQKYERGSNRVSASKLWLAAKALEVHVSYFFADLVDEAASSPGRPGGGEIGSTPEGKRLALAFPKLDQAMRNRIVDLVEALQKNG